MTTSEICRVVGKARSAIQVSIRTIRNGGISQLNLTDLEKKTIQEAINDEIAILVQQQPKFKLSTVSQDFKAAESKMKGTTK